MRYQLWTPTTIWETDSFEEAADYAEIAESCKIKDTWTGERWDYVEGELVSGVIQRGRK